MNRIHLLILLVALSIFSLPSHAAPYHAGNGSIVAAGVKFNSKKAVRQYQAVAVSVTASGTTTTEGGEYASYEEAEKASEKLAKKVANQELKAAKKEARQLNNAAKEGLWKKFKNWLSKKKDGVMARPDGRGDYCPDCMIFPSSDGDILIDVSDR